MLLTHVPPSNCLLTIHSAQLKTVCKAKISKYKSKVYLQVCNPMGENYHGKPL